MSDDTELINPPLLHRECDVLSNHAIVQKFTCFNHILTGVFTAIHFNFFISTFTAIANWLFPEILFL